LLQRNPNPWHSTQPSFASAIVSERFQSKITNGAFLVVVNNPKDFQISISPTAAAGAIYLNERIFHRR
jgi:hypothetical protein